MYETPGCPVDHLLEGEQRSIDIAERAADSMKDPEWLSGASGEALSKPDIWQLFIDGDDIAFCAQLRKEMQAQAQEEATDEVDTEERRRAA